MKKLILFFTAIGCLTISNAYAQSGIPLGVQDDGGSISRAVTIINSTDGIACTFSVNTATCAGEVVTSGSDGDSSTTQSDSGLEFVGGAYALLRGCTDNQILKWDETEDDWNCEADATGAGVDPGFDNAADPVVMQTTTSDVHIGDGAGTLAGKLEIGGDADQPQLVIEGFSTQTDDTFIIQNDADTEVFSIGNDGTIQTRSVDTASMADVDFGDFTCSSGSCTLDTGVVDSTAIGSNAVDSDELVDGSVDDSHLNITWSIQLPVQSAKITGGFITAGAQIEGGQAVWMGLFDASSTESMLWQFRYPDYCGGTPVANLTYSMASATTNKVDLEVDVMAVADGETPTTASFDTTNEVTGGTTVPGTAGFRDTVSITLSNNDSIAAGEMMIIRVNRDHDDTDDTATGDLELLEVEIECTR